MEVGGYPSQDMLQHGAGNPQQMGMYQAQAGSGPSAQGQMPYGMGAHPMQHGGSPQDAMQGGQGGPGVPGPGPGGCQGQQQAAGYGPMQGHPMQGGVPMGPDGSSMVGMQPYGMGDGSGGQPGGHPGAQGSYMYPGGCGGGNVNGGGPCGCGACGAQGCGACGGPQGCGQGGQCGGGSNCGYVLQTMAGMAGMMMPGGMMQGGAGMQGMPGGQPGAQPGMHHPNMQLVMMPGGGGMMQQGMQQGMQGQMSPQQMQQLQGMQMGMPPQHLGGQLSHEAMQAAMMGQTGPQGACGPMGAGLDHGKGGHPGVEGGDGKGGQRLAALNRNTQPKQGGNWQQGGGRGAGRPPADAAGGRMFEHGGFDEQQLVGDPGKGGCAGSAGGMPASPAGDLGNKKGFNKLRNQPKNPWADIQDSHGGFDQEMQQMWALRSPTMEGTPQRPQGQKGMQQQMGGMGGGYPPSPSGGKGKGGRKEGKGADDMSGGGKSGGGKDQHHMQKWVQVQQQPDPMQKGGKGHQRQDQWQPKDIAPKAQVAPHMPQVMSPGGKGPKGAPVPAPMPAPGGACGAAMASAAMAGGKNAKQKPGRRDGKLDDWLSARFGGQPPPTPTGSGAEDDWGDGKDGYEEAYEDDGASDRRGGKRKGIKGGGSIVKQAGKGSDKQGGKGGGGKGGKGKGKGGWF